MYSTAQLQGNVRPHLRRIFPMFCTHCMHLYKVTESLRMYRNTSVVIVHIARQNNLRTCFTRVSLTFWMQVNVTLKLSYIYHSLHV